MPTSHSNGSETRTVTFCQHYSRWSHLTASIFLPLLHSSITTDRTKATSSTSTCVTPKLRETHAFHFHKTPHKLRHFYLSADQLDALPASFSSHLQQSKVAKLSRGVCFLFIPRRLSRLISTHYSVSQLLPTSFDRGLVLQGHYRSNLSHGKRAGSPARVDGRRKADTGPSQRS